MSRTTSSRGTRCWRLTRTSWSTPTCPGIRRIQPAFDRSWIQARWRFAEPAGQPIVTVGYRERIPPLNTGVPGLILANTTQVYPEDRGTNYAVRLGEEAAGELLRSARQPVAG